MVYQGAPKEIEPKLKIISLLEDKKKIFPTSSALRRAAKKDSVQFSHALTAAGYFRNTVKFKLAQSDADKKTVTFIIDPGPAFVISDHMITYEQSRESDRPETFKSININVGSAADGASLQSNQQKFLNKLWDSGYPAARITARSAQADMDAGTAVAIYEFNSGPKAFFAGAVITGLERTKEAYIRKLTTWDEGTVYNKTKTIEYRDKLAATNLFSTIDVAPGPTGPQGQTPILVNLKERKHRTIGAGVSFSTSEGPGVRLFFENRNLLKSAERLRVDLNISQIEQSAAATLEKPLETLPGHAFLQGSFVNETTDAFDARTARLGGGLVKTWFEQRLETRGGVLLEATRIIPNNNDPREDNFFMSLPLAAIWNSEDDVLNPTKGVLASFNITSTTGTHTFTQIETSARGRINFGPEKRFTTALRARLGSTLAISLDDLPLNKRFFSGGGGSVRGYGFQLAGPVEFGFDEDGQIIREENGDIATIIPTGGRSVIEGAFEARYRVTQNIQLAAFIDASSVSASSLPDFSQDVFAGVGGGIRYFTPVGPLRVDIGIPLNKREFDAPVQFLISLGQSF